MDPKTHKHTKYLLLLKACVYIDIWIFGLAYEIHEKTSPHKN